MRCIVNLLTLLYLSTSLSFGQFPTPSHTSPLLPLWRTFPCRSYGSGHSCCVFMILSASYIYKAVFCGIPPILQHLQPSCPTLHDALWFCGE